MNDERDYCRMIASDFIETHFPEWETRDIDVLATVIEEQRELVRKGVRLAHDNSHVLGTCVLCEPGRI